MPLSLSHLGFGYLMDVVRPDLGCDGESWHRSKPLQRCKLKITGLCKLCTYGCIMIGALITPGITQTRILERSGYNCHFSVFPLRRRFANRVRVLINLARLHSLVQGPV